MIYNMILKIVGKLANVLFQKLEKKEKKGNKKEKEEFFDNN